MNGYDRYDSDGPHCPACGDLIDFCRGHGEIGDPAGYEILTAHDEGYHADCHPLGCDEAPDPYGDALPDIRARAANATVRRAADGRIYDDYARAVEDRRILLAEIDRLTRKD